MIGILSSLINMNPGPVAVFNNSGELLMNNKEYDDVMSIYYNKIGIALSELLSSEYFNIKKTETTLNNEVFIFVYLKKKQVNALERSINKHDECSIGVMHDIGNLLTVIKGEASFQDSIENLEILTIVLKKLYSKITNREKCNNKELLYKTEVILKEAITTYRSIGIDLKRKLDRIDESSSQIADLIMTRQKYLAVHSRGSEQICLFDLVNDCIKLSETKINNVEVDIVCDISPLISIKVDPVLISQIINNLIKNTIEALSERRAQDPFMEAPFLIINCIKKDKFIKIMFEDNGIGISKLNKEKLLEFGYSTKNRGSGFGLSHSNSLLEKSGGSLTIDSEGINKGAQVNLELLL